MQDSVLLLIRSSTVQISDVAPGKEQLHTPVMLKYSVKVNSAVVKYSKRAGKQCS